MAIARLAFEDSKTSRDGRFVLNAKSIPQGENLDNWTKIFRLVINASVSANIAERVEAALLPCHETCSNDLYHQSFTTPSPRAVLVISCFKDKTTEAMGRIIGLSIHLVGQVEIHTMAEFRVPISTLRDGEGTAVPNAPDLLMKAMLAVGGTIVAARSR